jgi:hypothetical protein
VITGVVAAWRNFQGDFLSAWPGWYAAGWNPIIYEGSLSESWWEAPIWSYGPILHLVYLPFTLLPERALAYKAILLACFGYILLAFLALAVRGLRLPSTLTAWALLIFVWANFFPLYEGLIQRTIELLELLLIVLAYLAYVGRRDWTAGALIGVAAMTKFLPAIFIPYFIWKRRWRCVGGSLGMVIVVGVMTQVTLGWQNNFLFRGAAQSGFARSDTNNQAISGLVMRSGRALWPSLEVWPMMAAGASVVVALMLVAIFVARTRAGIERWEWSFLLVPMIMCLPWANPYYYLFMLIPFSFLAEDVIKRRLSASWLIMTASSFALIAWPLPLSMIGMMLPYSARPTMERLLTYSLPTIGAVVLLVVIDQRMRTWTGGEAGCSPS